MKLFLLPTYDKPDKADGGIRRVIEAQKKYLPAFDVELVPSERDADVCAYHAMDWQNPSTPSKPVVSHCHGLYWREYNWGKFAGHINKCVMQSAKAADVVTAPTEWVAHALKCELWIEPVVLPHGVDLEAWPFSPEPACEGGKGYILWNKARMDVISNPVAIHALSQRLMDVEFVSTFAPDNVTRNVRVIGALGYDHARELVVKCGIYLATTRETFGIGTIEAMACGKPILGWDWGGTSEIVTHRQEGYLAKVGDYDELVEGYHYIQANYIRMAQAARRKIELGYQWKPIIERYSTIYKHLYTGDREMLVYV